MTVICIEMGWDYYTYMSQPTWFIDQVTMYFNKKYKAIKKANK